MANSISFNGVDLSAYGFTRERGEMPIFSGFDAPSVSLDRGDGSVSAPARIVRKSIAVSGLVIGAGRAALLTNLNAIAAALNQRTDCVLKLDNYADRQWRARVDGRPKAESIGTNVAKLSIDFICDDPLAEGLADSTVTDTITASDTVKVPADIDGVPQILGGSAVAYPEIIITLSAPIGAPAAIAVENVARSERILWNEPAGGALSTGDKVKFECSQRRMIVSVCPSGGAYAESMAGVEGRFPGLTPGVTNTLTFTGAAGGVTIVYRNRFI